MRSDTRPTALPEWDEPRRSPGANDRAVLGLPKAGRGWRRWPFAVSALLVAGGAVLGGMWLGHRQTGTAASSTAAVTFTPITSTTATFATATTAVAPSTTLVAAPAPTTVAPAALTTVPTTVVVPAGPVVRPKATLGAGLLTLSGSLPSQALVDQLSAAAKSLVANVGGGYVVDPRSPYSTGGTIEVTDLLRFDRGGTDPTPESKGLLDSVAFIMTKAPDSSIVVAAYTDNEGDPLRNVGLAANRIDSIVAYLATKGIAPSRVVPAPRGGAEPIADNATEEGRAANRRAKVWINFALGT